MRFIFVVGGMFLGAHGLAGPNAGVFCHEKIDGNTLETLALYDFAIRPDAEIISFRGKSVAFDAGEQAFEMAKLTPQLRVKGKTVTFSLEKAEVELRDKNGELPTLVVTNNESKVIGTVETVVFYNSSQADIVDAKRLGKVEIVIAGTPKKTLKFLGCEYEGGSVRNWKKMFGKN